MQMNNATDLYYTLLQLFPNESTDDGFSPACFRKEIRSSEFWKKFETVLKSISGGKIVFQSENGTKSLSGFKKQIKHYASYIDNFEMVLSNNENKVWISGQQPGKLSWEEILVTFE
jgi:hypothetical protein